MIIDISNNSGRRVIKNGYVEAVSSHMWIGEEFWNVLGCNNESELLKLNNGINITKENGLIKIVTSDTLYTEEDNDPEVLDLLRKTIFIKTELS